MSEQEYLIDWLHKAESDPKDSRKVSKRLPSIVSELYFERRLSTREDLGWHIPLSFGWTVHYDKKSDGRHWFKISERDEDATPNREQSDMRRQTDKAFITAIAAVNRHDRFFVVVHNVKMEAESRPSLNWKILEVEIVLSFLKQKEDQTYADNLCRKTAGLVDAALQDRMVCKSAQTIAPWLYTMGVVSLRRLFITRCFMNFSGLYLTDIDAVGLDHSGKSQVIEFKRKGPAGGAGYQLVPPPESSVAIVRYLQEIAALKKERPENAKAKLHDPTYATKIVSDCFGLDTSHAKNAELCHRAGMTYRYLIWNTTETDLEKLFTTELELKENPVFLALDVVPSHIEKISMTFGGDSGTYTSGIRFQLMISVDNFTQISIVE